VLPGTPPRLSRAAALAFTASLASAGVTGLTLQEGCGSSDVGSIQPMYGNPFPAPDSGDSSDAASDGSSDAKSDAKSDASDAADANDAADASDGPADDGTNIALYGAPAPTPEHFVTAIPKNER
jgi:hypothetical protein